MAPVHVCWGASLHVHGGAHKGCSQPCNDLGVFRHLLGNHRVSGYPELEMKKHSPMGCRFDLGIVKCIIAKILQCIDRVSILLDAA